MARAKRYTPEQIVQKLRGHMPESAHPGRIEISCRDAPVDWHASLARRPSVPSARRIPADRQGSHAAVGTFDRPLGTRWVLTARSQSAERSKKPAHNAGFSV